jgi:mono/diheme cytochrome c family protein
MTGMPSWRFRMSDDDIWALVAFIRTLPQLSPRDYQALRTPEHRHDAGARPTTIDIRRGREAARQYGCATCHEIPGIIGPNAPVGPPLTGFAARSLIAGVLPNTSENLVHWIRSPDSIKPGSAMPDLGVGERDAIDIAAYLATLQ